MPRIFTKREDVLIADASPLIFLSKLDRLHLLKELADRLIIPVAVWQEVMAGGALRPEVEEIRSRFEAYLAAPDRTLAAAYATQVDQGEAAALALAAHLPGALLLMDDGRGRAIAKAAGFRVIGTLGLLLKAKQAGLIPAIRPELDGLEKVGMFLGDALIRRALLAANEPREP